MYKVTVISKDSGTFYRYSNTPMEGLNHWAMCGHTILRGWYYSPNELRELRKANCRIR